jgi:methyl-accepting chemotaxis protein
MGVAGALGTLALASFGFAFVQSGAGDARAALGVTHDLVEAVSQTVEGVERTLSTASEGLDTVQDTLADGAGSLIELSVVAEDLAEVVSSDIPDSIEAVRGGMPQLIRTAGVIDGAMRALRLIGVDYDPDDPLDEALAQIDVELAGIPERLREQAGRLDDAARSIADFGRASFTIASDIGELRRRLQESRDLVGGYDQVVAGAIPVLDRLEDQVESQARTAKVAVVVLGVVILASQSVPIGLGWWVLRGERPSNVQRKT